MSIISSFTVQQPAGNTIASGVDCQLDNISPIVIAGSGGAVPHNSSELISLSGPIDGLQNGALLLDEVNVDAKGNPVQYRVSGNVEQFDDHTETMVAKNVQVTP